MIKPLILSQDLVSIDWTFLAQLIAFALILYVLIRFMYKPVTTAMETRANTIRVDRRPGGRRGGALRRELLVGGRDRHGGGRGERVGSSDSDVFAVGNGGTVLHHDGASWSAMTSGTSANLAGVWGSASGRRFRRGIYDRSL